MSEAAIRQRLRQWVAQYQYCGLKPVWRGTFLAESEAEARKQFSASWAETSPHPEPNIVAMVPGAVILQLEDGNE